MLASCSVLYCLAMGAVDATINNPRMAAAVGRGSFGVLGNVCELTGVQIVASRLCPPPKLRAAQVLKTPRAARTRRNGIKRIAALSPWDHVHFCTVTP